MHKAQLPSTTYHNGIANTSITINVTKQIAWRKISNIIDLDWLKEIKKTAYITKKMVGIGAGRRLEFQDGSIIDEYIVGWNNDQYFSYIATSGLPLRAYHATISLTSLAKKSVRITWKSYFNSELMTKNQFDEFCSFIELFYKNSLKALKDSLE
tara:strand:- start:7 stop:468 length:462 start_codon:yes stop_codon:yes gene_type:complete